MRFAHIRLGLSAAVLLAVDGSGRVHMSYSQASNAALKYIE